jgi:hypothetical protein
LPRELEHDAEADLLPMLVINNTAAFNPGTNVAIPSPLPASPELVPSLWTAAVDRWRGSGTEWQLGQLFDGEGSVPVPAHICKVVGFGLGTMVLGSELERCRAAFQHAMLRGIRDELARHCDGEVGCFAQDPAYQPADWAVLAAAGVQVLDDPRAFLEVDETTVVVSFSPSFPLREIIADIARPAVMICAPLPRTAEVALDQALREYPDPATPRVFRMLRSYDVTKGIRFPQTLCGRTRVFVRRETLGRRPGRLEEDRRSGVVALGLSMGAVQDHARCSEDGKGMAGVRVPRGISERLGVHRAEYLV